MDILGEAKHRAKELDRDSFEWRLIEEVERLRSQSEATAEYDWSAKAEAERQIESLTKERDEALKNNGEISIEFCKQIDELEAENAKIKEELDNYKMAGPGLVLQAENRELKKKPCPVCGSGDRSCGH